MKNLSLQVETIRNYIRKGYPEGIEPMVASVSALLKRIDELERALIPFARASVQASNVNNTNPVLEVYGTDCRKAHETLSTEFASTDHIDTTQYIPAEG